MATFTPPTTDSTRFVDPSKPRDYLFSRLSPLKRGVNVYKLTDNTYTETLPTDRSTISILYFGGHIHDVSDVEATALTTAGYGAYLT